MKGIDYKSSSEKWREDCLFTYDKELTGLFQHYCPEWDFLPIDNTCSEFEVCRCYPKAA